MNNKTKPKPKKAKKVKVWISSGDKQAKPVKKNAFDAIKRSLENPRYKYRTLHGVSREAHVDIRTLNRVIKEHQNEIVTLHRRGKNGEVLLTTREHYKKKASVKEKVMGAILNRVY